MKWNMLQTVVEADQFNPDGQHDLLPGVTAEEQEDGSFVYTIQTGETPTKVFPGDYIYVNDLGEISAMPEDTFLAFHEPADDDDLTGDDDAGKGPFPTEALPTDTEIDLGGTSEALLLDLSRRVGAGEITSFGFTATDINNNKITGKSDEAVAQPQQVRAGGSVAGQGSGDEAA